MKNCIIGATEFKAKCLALLDEVEDQGTTITVTKRGRPVATIAPAKKKAWRSPKGILAGKVKITGDMREKQYYRHSMYPGGLKSISQEKLIATRPERVIEYAVKGMLPHNALGARLLKRLKVYAGPEHRHESQVNAGNGKSKQRAATGASE